MTMDAAEALGSAAQVKARGRNFPLAEMSGTIRVLTIALLAIPVLFLWLGATLASGLLLPGLLVAVLYLWVWLWLRPQRFIVHADTLEVQWPLRRRRIPRRDIRAVRLLDRNALLDDVGFCMRIGAGGLWGGFGWLWTQRRGLIEMSISRMDAMVWIERVSGRPWLLTPAQPQEFVRALSAAPPA